MKRYLFALTVAALLIAGCSDNPVSPLDGSSSLASPNSPFETSAGGVTPIFYSGNTNAGICDAGQLYFKIDPAVSGTYAGITFTVHDESQGQSLSWESAENIQVHKVAVKGGPNYNLYKYNPPDLNADSDLISPLNRGGNVPNISHFDFCYTITSGCVWHEETAWSDGHRYVEQGNWAMYTPYSDGTSVNLIAGQHYTIGTVSFVENEDDSEDVDITITFNESGRFADVMENLKIHGYTTAPSGNPSPGQFANKYTVGQDQSSVTVTVPLASYYGVHVDAERAVCAAE